MRKKTHKGQTGHKNRARKHMAWGSCLVVTHCRTESLDMSFGDRLSGRKGFQEGKDFSAREPPVILVVEGWGPQKGLCEQNQWECCVKVCLGSQSNWAS